MKISWIDVFQLDIPLEKPKRYPNRTYESLDDTIVRLETDTGLVGWGEVCPIASTYVSSYFSNMRYDEEAPRVVDGFLEPNEKPGLGVEPDMSILGEPARTFG